MPTENSQKLILRTCQTAFFCVLAVIGVFFATVSFTEIYVDTDLKSMSPDIVKESSVQQAIDTVSQSIEKRFLLVLKSESIEDVEDASELLSSLVKENAKLFTEVDSLDSLDKLKTLLGDYRFQVSPSRGFSPALSDEKILDAAKRRLYSLDSSSRIFSIIRDPFGFLEDLVLSTGQFGNTQDYPLEVYEDGTTAYYFPLFFSINTSALNLETQELIEAELVSIKTQTKAQYNTVTFLHSGVFFFARDAAKKSQKDISFISAGSSLSILILLLVVFRSLKPLLLPIISVIIGISFGFVICHILFGSVHIITMVFGAGLIGVVIDYALHFCYHNKDDDWQSNLTLYKALIFSLFTSSVGYGALAFSDIDSLKRVALFSTLGLFTAWLTVISVGSFFTEKTLRIHDRFIILPLQSCLNILTKLNEKHIVIFFGAVIALFSFFLLAGIHSSDDPRLFFKPDERLLQEEITIGNITSSLEPGNYLVIRGGTVEEVYTAIQMLKQGGSPEYSKLVSITSWLVAPQKQRENYRLNERFYGKNGIAYPFLNDLGVDSDVIQDIKNEYSEAKGKLLAPSVFSETIKNVVPPIWLETPNGFFSFVLIPRGLDTDQLEKLSLEHENIYYINTAKMSSTAIKAQRESAFYLIFLAIFLIGILVTLRYKSFKSIWLVSVPLTSIVMTLCIFQLFSVPLTLFHVMALFLVLGLGMDYVIFVTDLNNENVRTIAAVALSAITSLISFGLLSVSSLPVVQAFGLTVLIGNSLNFVGALLLSSQQRRINSLNRS